MSAPPASHTTAPRHRADSDATIDDDEDRGTQVKANGSSSSCSSSKKPYEDSDSAYFSYYSLLTHQSQMLQDHVRTSTYQRAILGPLSSLDFKGKTIMDVGAGNGILSLFATLAGAERVWAVEASNVVQGLRRLVRAAEKGAVGGMAGKANEWLVGKLRPLHTKIESLPVSALTDDPEANPKPVDTLISECLGVLLLHERMCESYIDARDRFLRPGGNMYPSRGAICLAPFEDRTIWDESEAKGRWWDQESFYGVDLRPFLETALDETFSSPVVGHFNSSTLLSAIPHSHPIDFRTVSKEELQRFDIELQCEMTKAAVVHGIAGWFDLWFDLPEQVVVGGNNHVSDGAAAAQGQDEMIIDLMAAHQEEGQGEAATGTADEGGTAANNMTAQQLLFDGDSLGIEGAPLASPTQPAPIFMTTSPSAPPTHWQQVRFLLSEPLALNKGQTMTATIRFQVNEQRSYTMDAEVGVKGREGDEAFSRSQRWFLDRQTYSWTSGGGGAAAATA